ncbi:MAG TPA: DUF2256 domain-containing protein [Saccharospirillum sp.]|nr:DUF2256 domain-containing protein [Saccharospirillum sp.]
MNPVDCHCVSSRSHSAGTLHLMSRTPRSVAKQNLPEKVCLVCQRPFSWRKKWADCWDSVKYCSERCRRSRKNHINTD